MALVGAAQFLLEVVGLPGATSQLDKFQKVAQGGAKKVNDTMDRQAKTVGKTVGAYAAFGAALPGIFGELISSSSVADSVFGGFMDVMGGFADVALNALMPVFQPILDLAVQFLQWFQTIPAPVQALIGVLILLVPAIIGVSIAMTVLEGAGGPIIAIIVAIIAAVLAITFVVQHWGEIMDWLKKNILDPVVNFLTTVFGPVAAWLVKEFTPLYEFFKWLWDNIVQGIIWFVKTIVVPMAKLLIDTWVAVVNFFKPLVDFFKGIWDGIVGGLRWLWNLFRPIIQGILDLVVGLVNGLIAGANAIGGLFGVHLNPITTPILPTLKEGGEVLKTGPAIVHRGEVFSGVPAGGGAPSMGTLHMEQHFHFDTGMTAAATQPEVQNQLRDLFAQLGVMQGQRILETVRRRQ